MSRIRTFCFFHTTHPSIHQRFTYYHYTLNRDEPSSLDRLYAAVESARHMVIFSGSGLSATSGMSTFSTKGGLYEQAQRKYKLQDGKLLFTYSWYDRHRQDAQAFFADIFLEASAAHAAPGHYAIAALQREGVLQRHYTLNIDGMAEKVGMNVWHPDSNPGGSTVEMHGNVHYLVCTACEKSLPLSIEVAQQLRNRQPVPCPHCLVSSNAITTEAVENEEEQDETHDACMRFKVMLYEDAEGECITPEEVMDLMEADVQAADLILWVGISFQQSASTAYFRKVRGWLQKVGRAEEVVQGVVNPSDEALWNLMTACSNQQELNVIEVLSPADEVLPLIAKRVVLSRSTVPVGVGVGVAEDNDKEEEEKVVAMPAPTNQPSTNE